MFLGLPLSNPAVHSISHASIHCSFDQVSGMCEKFIDLIERRLHDEDISLENNPDSSSIAIAFAVYNSRVQSDVERDLRKGG